MEEPIDKLSRAERDILFAEQSEAFIQRALDDYGFGDLPSVEQYTARAPVPLQPVLLNDYRDISPLERQNIRENYFSRFGVAYFISLNTPTSGSTEHPLFTISNQLRDDLNLYYPLEHPLEGHQEAVRRFGETDRTVKIYDLKKTDRGYREQGETSEMFSMHTDGLGSGGTVQTTALYMDSPVN